MTYENFNPSANENLDDILKYMTDENFNPGANENLDDIESKPQSTPVVSNIASRLNAREIEDNADEDEGIKTPKSTFDLASLTPDDLAILKAKLSATPDRLIRKKGNPIVTMRRIDDKFIVKFKKAYQKQVMNEELQKKEEVHIIPVLFYGETEYVDIRWDAFQLAERVKCEVIDMKSREEEFFDGVTVSRETGQEVEMYKKMVKYFFTVKLTETDKVEIEAEYANA